MIGGVHELVSDQAIQFHRDDEAPGRLAIRRLDIATVKRRTFFSTEVEWPSRLRP